MMHLRTYVGQGVWACAYGLSSSSFSSSLGADQPPVVLHINLETFNDEISLGKQITETLERAARAGTGPVESVSVRFRLGKYRRSDDGAWSNAGQYADFMRTTWEAVGLALRGSLPPNLRQLSLRIAGDPEPNNHAATSWGKTPAPVCDAERHSLPLFTHLFPSDASRQRERRSPLYDPNAPPGRLTSSLEVLRLRMAAPRAGLFYVMASQPQLEWLDFSATADRHVPENPVPQLSPPIFDDASWLRHVSYTIDLADGGVTLEDSGLPELLMYVGNFGQLEHLCVILRTSTADGPSAESVRTLLQMLHDTLLHSSTVLSHLTLVLRGFSGMVDNWRVLKGRCTRLSIDARGVPRAPQPLDWMVSQLSGDDAQMHTEIYYTVSGENGDVLVEITPGSPTERKSVDPQQRAPCYNEPHKKRETDT